MREDWECWLAEYQMQWDRFKPGRGQRAPQCPEEAVRRLAAPTPEDVAWLLDAWKPREEGGEYIFPDLRSFVLNALGEAADLGEALFQPLLDAGINEVDPSSTAWFIRPCVKAFGHRRVNEYLLEVFATDNNFRKAGAVNAMYWAQVPLSYPGGARPFTYENASAESRQAYEALHDIWARKREALLTTFVWNDNVDVRRSIIGKLNLNAAAYPEHLRDLVPRAIVIARASEDEYIRHQVEVQLGAFVPLMALPHRARTQ